MEGHKLAQMTVGASMVIAGIQVLPLRQLSEIAPYAAGLLLILGGYLMVYQAEEE